VRTLYLDFETDLYDLGGRNLEIRGRRLALRCIRANRDFLQTAMLDAPLLGITITRLNKIIRDVLRIDAAKFIPPPAPMQLPSQSDESSVPRPPMPLQ
jgi:hypothetical protein